MPSAAFDPYRQSDAPEIDYEEIERDVSSEPFDRVAFALEVLTRLSPRRVTVAVVHGKRVQVQAGRAWGGRPGERWALLSVTPNASRRAIAAAVASLGGVRVAPWELDVLSHAG